MPNSGPFPHKERNSCTRWPRMTGAKLTYLSLTGCHLDMGPLLAVIRIKRPKRLLPFQFNLSVLAPIFGEDIRTCRPLFR